MKFNGAKGLHWKLDASKCLGDDCGTCTRHCVGKALKLEGGHLKYDPSKCILCGECMSRCLRKAISIVTDDLEGTINSLIGRYDGQCGDLGFGDNKDYASEVLKTTPYQK